MSSLCPHVPLMANKQNTNLLGGHTTVYWWEWPGKILPAFPGLQRHVVAALQNPGRRMRKTGIPAPGGTIERGPGMPNVDKLDGHTIKSAIRQDIEHTIPPERVEQLLQKFKKE